MQIIKDTIKIEETGPNPIAYANYFLLSTSKAYSELRLRNEAEYRLFMELKRRTETKILDQDENAMMFESGDVRVVIQNEEIFVLRDGGMSMPIKVEEFVKKPNGTLKKLFLTTRFDKYN